MLGLMLGWIPIIGPIIDGIVSIFNKRQDVDLGKYTIDSTTRIEELKAATAIQIANKDDIGVRLSRDLVIFPVSCWVGLYAWDTIMALRFPGLMWHLADFPKEVAYLPGAVLTFLLGNAGLNIWRRK